MGGSGVAVTGVVPLPLGEGVLSRREAGAPRLACWAARGLGWGSGRARDAVPGVPQWMAALWAVLQIGVVSDLPGPGPDSGPLIHAEIQGAEGPSTAGHPWARTDCPTTAAPLCALADGGTACGWTIGAG